MSCLHAYFTLRNQKGFRRLLDACRVPPSSSPTPAQSSSAGRSLSKSPAVFHASSSARDVNSRDYFGRTVLHLACASLDPTSIEFVKLLLAHPAINVNLQDTESSWTALHRALYVGNIAAGLLLLQRSDTDLSVKDSEGYTAFDLYNSTVDGTKPDLSLAITTLFTWGTNRNAGLGAGSASDRAFPEQLILRRLDAGHEKMTARLLSVYVTDIAMARLHTAVVTSEPQGNLRICGFGSGGRLGSGKHTQYALMPLQNFQYSVISVALGQDHTLVLTSSGEVLSWGMNRFAQLGYIVEPSPTSRPNDHIQPTPRKLIGPLKKEFVVGISTCKTSSACWTKDGAIYTWGTNSGQLGYIKAAHPMQYLPRIVPSFSHDVIEASITDTSMSCLLANHDVICLWNDIHFRISFSTQRFPPGFKVYGPQYFPKPLVTKITSFENTFAALTSEGEVFVFTLPKPVEGDTSKEKLVIKPHLVWELRKKSTAVKDVALGSEGSIILSTESGHVFVRSSNPKVLSGKPSRFFRVPFLQRVFRVATNGTGAYAALSADAVPDPIVTHGNELQDDLLSILPYLPRSPKSPTNIASASGPISDDIGEDAMEMDIQVDLFLAKAAQEVIMRDEVSRNIHGKGLFEGVLSRPAVYGADIIIRVGQMDIPAHRMILAARSPALFNLFRETKPLHQSTITIRSISSSQLDISGCDPFTVCLLLQYLYSDDIAAVWDRRIGLDPELSGLRTKFTAIKSELQILAQLLELPILLSTLDAVSKRAILPQIGRDLWAVFCDAQQGSSDNPIKPDVALKLSDRNVYCHSPILRARSPFFASFFGDEDWTSHRWDAEGILHVEMTHLEWRIMSFIFEHLYSGAGKELFVELDFIHSTDDLIDLLFTVLAAANELLLDKLLLICSSIILHSVSISNVCAVLVDATHYNATALIKSLYGYMARNLESLLESRLLEDLPLDIIKDFSAFTRAEQVRKSPFTRSKSTRDEIMARNKAWLELQDIPTPIVKDERRPSNKESLKVPPISVSPASLTSRPSSPPRMSTFSKSLEDGEVFPMDDDRRDVIPSLIPDHETSSTSQTASSILANKPWKGTNQGPSFRSNLKDIMAEAESIKYRNTPKTRVVGFTNDEGHADTTRRTPTKISQRERRKPSNPELPKASALTPRLMDSASWGAATSSSESPSSPWRKLVGRAEESPTPGAFPVLGTSRSSQDGNTLIHESKDTLGRITSALPSLTKQTANAPSTIHPFKGSVITPVRPPPASIRKYESCGDGSSSAWTITPHMASARTSLTLGGGLSFATIQEQQIKQNQEPPSKKSIREIQEEEMAHRVEADFMQWWMAEEARIKKEDDAFQTALAISVADQPRKKARQRGNRSSRNGTSRTDRHLVS